jgi:hypothetical protein
VRKLLQPGKGETGLSLIEVSIFSVVLLGALATSYQVISNGNLARKRVKQFTGYVQFINFVRSVTSNQNNCGIGFGILSPNYSTGMADKSARSIKLNLGVKNQVSILTPVGEEYKTGVSIGAVQLNDLSITPSEAGTLVPGTTDTVHAATLNLLGQKKVASLIPIQPISIPLSIRLNSSKEMVSCSSYRKPNQELLPAAPCDQYSTSSLSTDGNSVVCKQVLCPTGKIPVGYFPDGQIRCALLPSCTGLGKALVKVNGNYLCKQLSCPDPAKPLPSGMDSDGFINECADLSSMIKACDVDTTSTCKALTDPTKDPGATTGYVCNTLPPDQNKFCKDDCSALSKPGGTCNIVNGAHSAQACINKGGTLAIDPDPTTTRPGRIVCVMSGSADQSCWSGWSLYGKTYLPDMGTCPPRVSVDLDWNGRDSCWPNCANQGDSFPSQFRYNSVHSSGGVQTSVGYIPEFTSDDTCKTWLKSQNAYQEDANGNLTFPAQASIPNGFFGSLKAHIDVTKYGCYVGINCKLCGQPAVVTALQFADAFTAGLAGTSNNLVGVANTLANSSMSYTLYNGGIDMYYISTKDACPSPNISYVFNRCDLNCYSGGVSSCHMTPAYRVHPVRFNVKTYCY